MIETWEDRQQKQAVLDQVRAAYKSLQQLVPTVKGKPRNEVAPVERAQLIEFLQEASKAPPSAGIKAFIVETPYPPCSTPFKDLNTVKLSELLLETHHIGKALIVRRIGPVWTAGVGGTYGMEDEDGHVDFLIFDGFSLPGDEVIPPGAVFVVKHPYCKVDTSGKPRVKVSHPTDIVLLRPQDELVPLTWRMDSTALEDITPPIPDNVGVEDVEELHLQNYDFEKIAGTLSKDHPRVDIGSYLRRVDIRPSAGRGRGLFATDPIKMSDIILVEKATFVTYNHEPQAYTAMKFDTRRSMITEDTRGAPFKDLARYLLQSPKALAKVSDLYAGPVPAPSAPELVDGKPVIDIFHLHEIWQNNAIACPTPIDPSSKAFPFRNAVSADSGSGLWCYTSYANHSCIPNAEKSIIGDLVVLRANRDIERREEIMISYGDYSDQEDKQQALSMVWGFQCNCELCQVEESTPKEASEHRQSLRTKATEPIPDQITAATLAEARTLVSDLEATYRATDETNNISHHDLPRLPVAEALSRLFALYSKQRDQDRAEETMLRILKETGLEIRLQGSNTKLLTGKKKWLIDEATVLSVSILSRLVKQRQDDDAAKYLDDLAKKLYETLNGCMTGYEVLQAQLPEV